MISFSLCFIVIIALFLPSFGDEQLDHHQKIREIILFNYTKMNINLDKVVHTLPTGPDPYQNIMYYHTPSRPFSTPPPRLFLILLSCFPTFPV